MSNFVIANFIDTTLSAAAGSGATSMTLASSTGLPTLTTGQVMPLVLTDAATGAVNEIVYVTAITGAVCTVERAQEGTTAQNWSIGDFVSCDPTAGSVQTYTAPSITTLSLTNVNVTLSLTQYSPKIINLTGTLTGNVIIYFPAIVRDWTVTNNCTGAYTVTLKTSAGGSTGPTIGNGSGDIYYSDATNMNVSVTPGITQSQADNRFAPLRNFLSGFNMTTTGGSASMPITSGQSADSTNAIMLTLASNYTKTTGAWAVGTGNGGLDSGSIAASTKYYWYVIQRPDTGIVDLICSLSASAPSLPSNYVYYRRLGMAMTNGSSQWVAMTQAPNSREFYWATPILDFSGAGSTTAALLTCSVPIGWKVKPFFNIECGASTTPGMVYLSDPDNADIAPSSTVSPLASIFSGQGASLNGSQVSIWTNTAGQVRHREGDTIGWKLATIGWFDPS